MAEDASKGMNVIFLNSIEQQFKMLSVERVDLAVVTRIEGLQTIKRLNLSKIYTLEPSIQKIPLYHYVNKKHYRIVPELTDVLKEMKNSGRSDTVEKRVLTNLLYN
ncbi:transporter substrate-binding domain-containing protein [Zooshikella ganghwensis]|uniref:transporter substrate-binding domain-containing protein n=1 Tax=Zooshikella ganghwensis TaxID=202772 RepID=UPI00041134E7